MSEAKLVSECFVRPQIEVDESKRIHHLNPFDLRRLSADNAQLGYLYAKPFNFSPSSYLEKLKCSLSQALVYFYPLAGQFVTVRDELDNSCCVYIDCCKGPGARLVYAPSHDLTMVQVLNPNSDVPEVVLSFFDLGEITVNHDGHTRPLLSVQLTELQDGVFLGVCYNHSVVDGVSLFHFQRVWSQIFMGTFSTSTPLPLVKQPAFLEGRVFKFPFLDLNEFITLSKTKEEITQSRRRYFRFSPNSLKKLKAMANSDANDTISTFQALMAFVWKCITRARNLPVNELTICELPVNLRPRFNPPLTNNYFGNYAIKTMGKAKVGDLLSNSVGWAAMLLKQSIEAQDDKASRALVKEALHNGPKLEVPTINLGSRNVIVGGSARFDLSESEFGLGRLVGYRGGYGNKGDGKIQAYLGSQGDGSVELDIWLAPHSMAALTLDEEFMCFVSHQSVLLNLTPRI